MREVTTTVYTIYELKDANPEGYERAIENYADFNDNPDFAEFLISETFPEMARERGMEVTTYPVRLMNGTYRQQPSIFFSGFYSQGDGASFEAEVDYVDYILARKLGNKYRTLLNHARRDGGGVLIRRSSSHYYHEQTMHIDMYDHAYDYDAITQRELESANRADEQAAELAYEILDDARDLAQDFYTMLREEYEYQTSEEQIAESLDINEIEFDIDGDVV